MTNTENINSAMQLSFSYAVQRMINKSCIIDFGIVKKVVANGVVNVLVSVAKNTRDVRIITCAVANIASSTFTIDTVLKEDDKVLVVYPRRYTPEMFDYDKNDVIINEYATGYNLLSGIAIPISQYKESSYFNLLKLEEGKLDLKLAYNKDDEENKFSLAVDDKGNVTLNCATINLNIAEDSEIVIETPKAKISIDTEGNITVDAMQGKIALKNNSASLYTILKDTLQVLNTSLATSGSPASHVVNPQQFSTQATQLDQLMSDG